MSPYNTLHSRQGLETVVQARQDSQRVQFPRLTTSRCRSMLPALTLSCHPTKRNCTWMVVDRTGNPAGACLEGCDRHDDAGGAGSAHVAGNLAARGAAVLYRFKAPSRIHRREFRGPDESATTRSLTYDRARPLRPGSCSYIDKPRLRGGVSAFRGGGTGWQTPADGYVEAAYIAIQLPRLLGVTG